MLDLTRFTSARMTGEPLGLQHFDLIFPLNQDPLFTATLGGTKTAEQTRSILTMHHDHWEQYGFGWWLLRDRTNGALLGRGGLRHVLVEGVEEVEIGYGIVPAAWGNGFASELAQACVPIAFEQLHLPDVVSFTLTTNYASQRVMSKAGLCYERDVTYANLPHVLYRLANPAIK